MVTNGEYVSERHSQLVHYTTVAAFENIYKSRSLWATYYEHMNDSTELTQFRLRVSEFIKPKIAQLINEHVNRNARVSEAVQEHGGISALAKHEAEMYLDIIHRTTFGEDGLQGAYISSFCTPKSEYETQNGLLSQWRGYGTDGGVAIVLDTKGIEDLMKQEGETFAHPVNHIADVTYDDDSSFEQRPEFRGVFDGLPGILCQFYSRSQPSFEAIFTDFIMGSTLVKHRAFCEEREVRIVVSPAPSKASIFFDPNKTKRREIKYRSKDNREIKYIELFGNASLPITRVIVGPSRIQNLNYQTINATLAGSAIEVRKSETPFLG